MTEQTVVEAPVVHEGRKGFLPIETNTFDRYFISVVLFVAVNLLYMRFIEPMGLPLWVASVASIVLGYIIVTRG